MRELLQLAVVGGCMSFKETIAASEELSLSLPSSVLL